MGFASVYMLSLGEVLNALREIQRVGKGKSYITLGAYRTKEEKELLAGCGVTKFGDLLKEIPPNLKIDHYLGLGSPLSELDISRELQKLSNQNQ